MSLYTTLSEANELARKEVEKNNNYNAIIKISTIDTAWLKSVSAGGIIMFTANPELMELNGAYRVEEINITQLNADVLKGDLTLKEWVEGMAYEARKGTLNKYFNKTSKKINMAQKEIVKIEAEAIKKKITNISISDAGISTTCRDSTIVNRIFSYDTNGKLIKITNEDTGEEINVDLS